MSVVFNFTFVPWFRSVAPYIHLLRGKTVVIGVTGEAIAAGRMPLIAQDMALIKSMACAWYWCTVFARKWTSNCTPKATNRRFHTACA